MVVIARSTVHFFTWHHSIEMDNNTELNTMNQVKPRNLLSFISIWRQSSNKTVNMSLCSQRKGYDLYKKCTMHWMIKKKTHFQSHNYSEKPSKMTAQRFLVKIENYNCVNSILMNANASHTTFSVSYIVSIH